MVLVQHVPPQVVLAREGLAPLSRVRARLLGAVVPPRLLVLVVDVAVEMGLGTESLPTPRPFTDVRPVMVSLMVTDDG